MTDVAGRPTSRFAQIAYTSSRGGFGIHSEAGEPTAAEKDVLVRGADPERTDFGQQLPRFAAPDEVARFNRNLVSVSLDEHTTATWHSAPAGSDQSGRPGNVFVHAVLDRTSAHHGERVIDTWRSPDWVTPYGASEVGAAALPAVAPSSGEMVGHRPVCDFLLDPAVWRLGVLSRLCDELAIPRGERGPVVLGVSSPDAGALWIGALAHLMSPGAAAQFGFGVWETSRALQSDRAPRLELICIPTSGVDSVRERFPKLTILRETDDCPLREWRADGAPGGDAWGALAVGMFSLAPDPEVVLLEVDDLARRVGDHGLVRHWPLAMAMARRLDSWDFLSHPIAAALRAGTPPELAGHLDLMDTTVDLVARHTGESAADAWAAVTDAAQGPITSVLQRIYVGRAVADDAWLTQGGGAPARRDPTWDPSGDLALSTEVAVALNRIAAYADPLTRAVTMVNLADLLVRVGWPTTDPDAVLDGRLVGALDHAVRPALADPAVRDRLTSMIHPCEGTRQDLLRPALADWPMDVRTLAPSPVGHRVPPEVLDWLYPGEEATSTRSAWPSQLDLEALARAAVDGVSETHRATARSQLLEHAITLPAPERDGEFAEILAAVGESSPLRAAEARRLISAGHHLSDAQVAAAVVGAGDAEASDVLSLLRDLVPAADRPGIANALHVLHLMTQPAWGAPTVDVVVDRYADKVLEAFDALWLSARQPAGPFWAGYIAAAAEFANLNQAASGALAALQPPGVAPGAAALFASLLSLPMTEQTTARRLDVIAARAMVCDPGFPKPSAPTSPHMVTHAILDPSGQPALTVGLAQYFAGLDKEALTACRDGLLNVTSARYGEDPEILDFARSWFGRVSGNRGVGERLRNVGGRIFGR
ncbi:MAG: hypothetical protein V9G19_07260 [Tetrasphaera sp.]